MAPIHLGLFWLGLSWYVSHVDIRVFFLRKGGNLLDRPASETADGLDVEFTLPNGLGKSDKMKKGKRGIPLVLRRGLRFKRYWVVPEWLGFTLDFAGLESDGAKLGGSVGARSGVQVALEAAKGLAKASKLGLQDQVLYIVMGGLAGAGLVVIGLQMGGLLRGPG